MNGDAAVLVFPATSVNVLAPTSIVVDPSPTGVNVAVYTVLLDTANELNVPPLTVISDSEKVDVASLLLKVTDMLASFVVVPLLTVELAIVIVGDVPS